MKPDEARLRNEMEEAEVVPMEVFIKLGLLVVESRVPEPSPKGRREGPHCPGSSAPNAMNHSCEQADFLCKRSTILEKQMSLLWKNRIPMCIEVLMYSQCGHGAQKVHNLDFSLPTNKNKCVLLEQWNIQAMPRRHGETVVRVRELYQALRSYLYFSQISAWLNATHGQVPANVAYRISPPGEFCTSSFQETPEWHTFPLGSIGKSGCLKVTVGVLQRQTDIISVPCPESHELECPDYSKLHHLQRNERPPWSLNLPCLNWVPDDGLAHQNLLTSKSALLDNPTTESSVFLPQASSAMQCMATAASSPSKDFQGACASSPKNEAQKYAVCKQKNTGAIPKRYMHKSPPTWGYKCHSLATPTLEPMSRSPELGGELPAVPKVLMSKRPPSQTYYQRDERKWVVNKSNKDSDSDHSSPEIDHYLKNIRTNLEPLSPEEIQTYLASLSIDGRSRSVQTPKDLSPISLNEEALQKPVPTLTKLQLHSYQDLSSPDITSFEDHRRVGRKKSPQLNIDLTHSGEDLTPTGSPRRSPSSSGSLKSTKRAESPLTRLLRESDLSSSPASDSSSPDSVKFNNGSSQFKEEISVENGSTMRKISDLPEEEQILSVHDRVCFSIGGDEEDSSGVNSCRSEQSSLEGYDRKDSLTADESDSGMSSRDEDLSVDHLLSPLSPTIPGPGFDMPTRPRVQKSLSESGHLSSLTKSNALFKTLLRKELSSSQTQGAINNVSTKPTMPSQKDEETFRDRLQSSAKKLFHSRSGLPLQSSPAPIKKRTSNCFDFDSSLVDVRAIKNSFSCVNLDEQSKCNKENKSPQKFYSASAPASTNSLLGSFEESILNGRLEPSGVVEGFTAEIGASGAFCPRHLSLPVTAFFFNLSDDNAPSPYLGHINLDHLGKRGYHIPKKGTIQVTLFNPNKTVVKMFVVVYDLSDIPPNCQTFIRQRTLYLPVKGSSSDLQGEPVYLRYLIHLRFLSSKSGKVYLHTDLRLIFARDKLEFDARVANYELRSYTEGPTNPKFSPKK